MRRDVIKKISKPFWFVFAALFLLEAWLWDKLGGLLTSLVAAIPFESFKQALARGLNKLPAPVALLVLLIPLAVIEPLKIAGLWLIANHHVFLGILAFVGAKFAGLGVLAFVFDATREKLLSMAWFARFYLWVLKVRQLAHDFLEPYKIRVREALAPFKQRLKEITASFAAHSGLGGKLALLRARARGLRGLT
jgi:hypothetical protein